MVKCICEKNFIEKDEKDLIIYCNYKLLFVLEVYVDSWLV